jgi:hypothetical protein
LNRTFFHQFAVHSHRPHGARSEHRSRVLELGRSFRYFSETGTCQLQPATLPTPRLTIAPDRRAILQTRAREPQKGGKGRARPRAARRGAFRSVNFFEKRKTAAIGRHSFVRIFGNPCLHLLVCVGQAF